MTSARASRWLAVGLVLLVAAAVGLHYVRHVRRHALHPGDRLLPLALSALDGSPARISGGTRPTVIHVFATWCMPCRAETPRFALLASGLQRRGVEVVGIDQQEEAVQVRAFAREFALPYPLYIDRTGVTHDVLGARMIPFTVYVDGSGVIRWQHAGPMSDRDMIDLDALARSAG